MIKHQTYKKELLKDKAFKEEYLIQKKLAKLSVLIQKERTRQGLSQQELALIAHVTQQQLSSIENGANYTIKTLYKIAQALKIKNLTLSFK